LADVCDDFVTSHVTDNILMLSYRGFFHAGQWTTFLSLN